jgi:DNA modification methylase
MPKARVRKFRPIADNPNKHTRQGKAMLSEAMARHGYVAPMTAAANGAVLDGNQRLETSGATFNGVAPLVVEHDGSRPVVMVRTDIKNENDPKARDIIVSANRIAEVDLEYDFEVLKKFGAAGLDLTLYAFDRHTMAQLEADPVGETEADEIPDERQTSIKFGDLFQLGRHRVLCGDSTDPKQVERLMHGETPKFSVAQLLHADPPYGMGKQADGVQNDNLYREKLDRFQMAWWSAWRPHLAPNASAYIWGNAPDLWRLWYAGGLAASETFEFRNEIVWDKKNIAGMASPDLTQYPEASERCLFFQFGNQFLGNVNADDFPETWEPLRSYMAGEADKAKITPPDIKRVNGCGMFSHWFTRSQFTLIPERHYATLAKAYPGRFKRPWAELKAEWARVRGSARDVINGKNGVARSYFDNAHDSMRDSWEFARVLGDERHGHATPKPVAMMERVLRSSCPLEGITLEPFCGTGSTLIAAEATRRACYTMELTPAYVDVTIRRWEAFTGLKAKKIAQPVKARATHERKGKAR